MNIPAIRCPLLRPDPAQRRRLGEHDPGGDHFTRLNPKKSRNNAVRQLEAMGYHVTLDQTSRPSHSAHELTSRESSRQIRSISEPRFSQ